MVARRRPLLAREAVAAVRAADFAPPCHPNVPEAAALTGRTVATTDDLRAGEALLAVGRGRC